jgi:hypothetical protein
MLHGDGDAPGDHTVVSAYDGVLAHLQRKWWSLPGRLKNAHRRAPLHLPKQALTLFTSCWPSHRRREGSTGIVTSGSLLSTRHFSAERKRSGSRLCYLHRLSQSDARLIRETPCCN